MTYDSLIDNVIAQKYDVMRGAIDQVFIGLSDDLKKIVQNTSQDEQRKAITDTLKGYAKTLPAQSLQSLTETANRYSDIADFQRNMFADLGYLIPPMNLDANTLSAVSDIARIEQEFVGGQSKLLTSTAKNVILRQVLGQDISKKDAVKAIAKSIDSLSNRAFADADTMLTTSINMIGRGVSERISTAVGVEWYKVPTRPLDRATRPFCEAVIRGKNPNSNGKIPYSQDSPNFQAWFSGLKPLATYQDGYIHVTVINALNNEQMPNCLITFGGYRCRHEWQAATMLKNQELIDDNPKLHEKYTQSNQ